MIRKIEWNVLDHTFLKNKSVFKDGREILCCNAYEIFTCRYLKSNVTNYGPYFLARTSNGEFYNIDSDWNFTPDYMWITHWAYLPEFESLSKS